MHYCEISKMTRSAYCLHGQPQVPRNMTVYSKPTLVLAVFCQKEYWTCSGFVSTSQEVLPGYLHPILPFPTPYIPPPSSEDKNLGHSTWEGGYGEDRSQLSVVLYLNSHYYQVCNCGILLNLTTEREFWIQYKKLQDF